MSASAHVENASCCLAACTTSCPHTSRCDRRLRAIAGQRRPAARPGHALPRRPPSTPRSGPEHQSGPTVDCTTQLPAPPRAETLRPHDPQGVASILPRGAPRFRRDQGAPDRRRERRSKPTERSRPAGPHPCTRLLPATPSRPLYPSIISASISVSLVPSSFGAAQYGNSVLGLLFRTSSPNAQNSRDGGSTGIQCYFVQAEALPLRRLCRGSQGEGETPSVSRELVTTSRTFVQVAPACLGGAAMMTNARRAWASTLVRCIWCSITSV